MERHKILRGTQGAILGRAEAKGGFWLWAARQGFARETESFGGVFDGFIEVLEQNWIRRKQFGSRKKYLRNISTPQTPWIKWGEKAETIKNDV